MSKAPSGQLRRKYLNVAVLLADSFNKRFAPISVELPRALLPVLNIPLIDYSIELLIGSGIETIYVFCVNHADKIQAHVNASQWAQHIKCIVSTTAATVGDALRRVGDEGVIETDFVLLHADVVGNINLGRVLHQHRLRKEADPTVLMTSIYKRATPTHASRSLEDDTVLGLSSENEILFWENSPDSSSVEIDPMLILGDASGAMRLRYDLFDTHIDVCSVEVLQLMKDNFDYQSVRGDFMTGVLGDDITDHRLFVHILESEYAARVKDLHTYASVSHDVLHRWVSPVMVDNSLLNPKSSYRLTRHTVYREKNVRTHLSSRIGPDVVLGQGCVVGESTVISKTVVGANVTIGKNCSIVNCFLWDGVQIEDNCSIEWSLLCNNVRVFLGSTVSKGCVVSFGVTVGPDAVVRSHSKLTRAHVDGVTRNVDLGNKGKGFLWAGDDDESVDNKLHISARIARKYSIGDDSGDEDAELGVSGASGRAGQEDALSETDDSVEGGAGGTDFDQEVREIVTEGIQSGEAVDNMVLEINGRKFAHDKTFFECVRCILWGILNSVPQNTPPQKPLLAALKVLLKKYKGLLEKFMQEGEETELMWALQEFLERDHARYMEIFPFIVHSLYDLDLLDEEAIFAWEKEQQELTGDDRKFLNMSAKFLEWLKTADDESD